LIPFKKCKKNPPINACDKKILEWNRKDDEKIKKNSDKSIHPPPPPIIHKIEKSISAKK
jgi:hypothetical protein